MDEIIKDFLLRAAGARIYVQDEASSVVWGMPGFVARNGLPHKILPLDQIGAEIVQATALQIARANSILRSACAFRGN